MQSAVCKEAAVWAPFTLGRDCGWSERPMVNEDGSLARYGKTSFDAQDLPESVSCQWGVEEQQPLEGVRGL